MKTYEKPQLMVLSLSGNDALCAACAVDAEEPNMDPNLKYALESFGYDIETCFASSEQCTNKIDVNDYCKFGPGQILFNS